MVDCVGNELKIGDKVICSDMNYADLLLGEIIGFTPKKIRVKYHRSIDGFDFRKDQLKHPYQVFKHEEVVRCKDCKHGIWDEEEKMWECILPVDLTGDPDTYGAFHEYNDGEHFCSYGERKDDVKK